MKPDSRVKLLLRRGVHLPLPETVYIAPEVDVERIASGVTIHSGCRLSGATLSIGPGCVVGREAPATVIACQLGANVHLAGGYFEGATFLNGFKAGSGAHVRPGCLFEECSGFAHCVGVKQTIFMPWVTAGSLINFCDALMAGGTSAANHSEIGSSFVHFNFTPHQDKATASLVGDVAHGVFLNQAPIFLGGQGGLVGPARIAYGTVLAAGQVWRGDVTQPGRLLAKPGFTMPINREYEPQRYSAINSIVKSNLRYIGNILALEQWYRVVRERFMQEDPFQSACYHGALQRIAEILQERFARMEELAQKVERSLAAVARGGGHALEQQEFVAHWPLLRERLVALIKTNAVTTPPPEVATVVDRLPQCGYIKAITSLRSTERECLTNWLAAVVERLFFLSNVCSGEKS